MKARSAFVFVALFLIAGRTQAGNVDKAKLRQLAHLPDISISLDLAASSISGFRFGEKVDHLVEIARLQKQMKGDFSDAERYLLVGKHYQLAKREKKSKEAFAKALAFCRQQVREHPDDMLWLIRLGESLGENGEAKEGEKLLRRAVKEAPNEWRGWLALAVCMDGKSVVAVLGDTPFSNSGGEQERIIPSLIERQPTVEQIAEMRRLRKEARGYYDRAVETAPHNEVKPYFRRWFSNYFNGHIDAGLRTIEGEKVNPKAVILAPECRADMRRIARLSPGDPHTIGPAMYLELGACIVQEELELKEDCSSWTEKIAARNRSLVDVLPPESREFVRWCLERLEQLTKHPDKSTAAAASEFLAEVMFVIQSANESLGRGWPSSANRSASGEKALEHLRRAVQLDPSREHAWDWLALMLIDVEKTDEAIAIARKRIAVKDNAHNRYFLAKAYAEGGHFDKAAKELGAGLKSDPKDLNCLLGLAVVALKHENTQSLQEAGKLLDAIMLRFKDEESRKYGVDYLLLRGIHSALTDHTSRAWTAFQQVLQMKKGERTATRALVALGEPLGSANRQLAIDYIEERSGQVEHSKGKAYLPVEKIYLCRHSISDEDIFVLTAFLQLRELHLSFTTITDAGLAQLTCLAALESLNLDGTKITDKGLNHLKALRGLCELSLEETAITDAGLEHLHSLKQLKRVCLKNTNVTRQGVAELQKALPKLEIYR